jgi:hypothetical protein
MNKLQRLVSLYVEGAIDNDLQATLRTNIRIRAPTCMVVLYRPVLPDPQAGLSSSFVFCLLAISAWSRDVGISDHDCMERGNISSSAMVQFKGVVHSSVFVYVLLCGFGHSSCCEPDGLNLSMLKER